MDNQKSNHGIKKTMPGRRNSKHLNDKKDENVTETVAVAGEETVEKEFSNAEESSSKEVQVVAPSDLKESETKAEKVDAKSLKKPVKKKKKSNKKPLIVAAIVVGLIAIIVIALVILSNKGVKVDTGYHNDNYMEKIQSLNIGMSEDEAINKFFKDYYNALCAGDIDALKNMFDKPNALEISDEVSTLVEAYNNLAIYTASGINDNEMAVFVRNDVKFYNINTQAPSVDCFYVTTDSKDGGMKIRSDMYKNADIIRYLTLCSYRDPIKTLLVETNSALDSALNNDKELKNLYIVMQSMTNAVLSEEDVLGEE